MSKDTKNSTEETSLTQKLGELQNVGASFRLNGRNNYVRWSQFIRTYLKGKGRLSHLFGTGQPAKKDSSAFKTWDEEDSLIMCWLWDSMEPSISDTCMFLTSAKDIWDFIQKTHFSKSRNINAQVYEIKVKIKTTKQGDKSVAEYANILESLWQELDHCYYGSFEMKDPENALMLKKYIERDRVYVFLAGLNSELFDQARIQIFGKEEVPSLEETISLLKETENHQWYTYCKTPLHKKDQCWKLHGKPPNLKQR